MSLGRIRMARLVPAILAGSLVATAGVSAAEVTNGLSLSVNPSGTVIVPGGTSRNLVLTNTGSREARYDISVGNYDISRDGQVTIDPPLTPGRSAKRWLTVTPRRVVLRSGESATLAVHATPSRVASPGDHHALVLILGSESREGTVRFRARIGVPMIVRVAGPLVRRLRVTRVTAVRSGRSRVIRVAVSNLGNVNERFTPQRGSFEILQRRRVVARLGVLTRSFLPGTSGFLVARYSGRVQGPVTIRARVIPAPVPEAGPGIATVPRPVVRTARVRF
jgi:hypothetical protein